MSDLIHDPRQTDLEDFTARYKVVWRDGYDRETVADRLIADDMNRTQAFVLCDWLRHMSRDNESDWFVVFPQSKPLWRGMEEFV